ncbi:MAG: helix-turn-helix domain-containing protein [Parasporobacterium sp.]|nr:helix-turn-helix domain-containing protein [Parasporobacterium sp.]
MSSAEKKHPGSRNFLPFSICYRSAETPVDDWHAETELFFILTGNARVILRDRSFPVQSEDVFLINAADIREISGTSWEAVILTFRQDLLPDLKSSCTARFDLCSSGNTYSTRYDYVRYCLAQLVSFEKKEEQAFSALGIFYNLYSHLLANFPAAPAPAMNAGEQNRDRLLEIIHYVNEHFRENLTLNETAARFSLTAPYFSAFFKKQSGKTFGEYYNDVRLSHAVKELLGSSASIESIALQNGFGDARAFTSLFKKSYGTLPNAYRKLHRTDFDPAAVTSSLPSAPAGAPLMDPPQLSAFPSLMKYTGVFREEADFITASSENPRIFDAGDVSFLAGGTTLSHNYHRMICVGSARQFLYKEVQDMLIRVQQEIRFQYVKFHGLLSDEMMVYTEDKDGTPHYSFTLIDKVLDFLQSVGMKPLFQLSFMPVALAEDPHRLMDFYHYNTSPPKDLKKWTDLVDATVRHCVARYGLEEVRSWLFCVWNEPDETVEQFSWNDKDRFFRFYEATYKTVKSICPEFRFGTPSLLLSVQKEYGWARDFFLFTNSHACNPDFLNIHYYDNSLFEGDSSDRVRSEKGLSTENMEHSFPLTADPHAMMKFINNVKALTRKHNMRSIPIYLTEWNLTISHRDLINDTCFKSCHLVKNLLENYDRLESFSYWSLTDFIEEMQLSPDLYHGGLGLFTFNGIPKANYNAFLLLGKLGNELLRKGEGYFITRAENSIRILLYNYEHYSRLFATGHRTELNIIDRYSPFEEMSTAQFAVRLSDLPGSRVLIKEYFVNQYAGSSYDTWARMGSQPLNSREDYNLLMQESRPGLHLHREPVLDGVLPLHVRLAPLEVRLIEVDLL